MWSGLLAPFRIPAVISLRLIVTGLVLAVVGVRAYPVMPALPLTHAIALASVLNSEKSRT